MRVRGGFDSHAFPPQRRLAVAAVLALLVAAGAAAAQTPRPAARDTTSRFDRPRWVMLRSLLVPGWGQAHNRAWIKAAAIAGTESWLALRVAEDQRALSRLERRIQEARDAGDEELETSLVGAYNRRLDGSVGRGWMLGGVVLYAVVDAYVDAHFRGFDVEFGPDTLAGGGAGGVRARAGWRWTF